MLITVLGILLWKIFGRNEILDKQKISEGGIKMAP